MTVQFSSSYPVLGLYVNFSGSTFTDISAYVRSISTNRPGSRETNRFGIGTMSVVLDNRDGRFSPANTSGPYSSGGVTQVVSDIKVRLEATWSGTTHNLFCGYVEDWQDDFPAMGKDATTTLTVVDPLAQLASWVGTPLAAPVGAQESSGSRIARILDAAGFPAATRSLMAGDETLQGTLLGGGAVEQLNLTADSEGGTYWYDPNLRSVDTFGAFVFESRTALSVNSRSNTSQATFSAASVRFRDPVTSSGRDQLLRSAGYTRVGGVEQSAGSGLPRAARQDLLTFTDAGVKGIVDLLVAKGTQANAYRVERVTIEPIVSTTTMWPKALGLRIRDRASVSMTVPVSSLAINRNVFIDGISHSITPMRWTTTFTFASATAWDGFSAAAAFGSGTWDTSQWWPY